MASRDDDDDDDDCVSSFHFPMVLLPLLSSIGWWLSFLSGSINLLRNVARCSGVSGTAVAGVTT